jgi:hypothetical protein
MSGKGRTITNQLLIKCNYTAKIVKTKIFDILG